MDLIAKDDTNIEDLVIENSFKILTNQRWKTYKLNIKTKNLLENLEKTKVKREQEDFQKWLCRDIHDVYAEDDAYLSVHCVLEALCEDVKSIIIERGCIISNEKEFRDNVATMIYKESRYG
jgi:hypothetical protein|tara:strand:+ start:364 stop:726 length:363 start_codon:yes stop_codon:yes gene_type:complete